MYTDNDYRLYHHGIKGQRWGVRRYQNDDGSLTEAGKKRYAREGLVSKIKRNVTTGDVVGGLVGSAAYGLAAKSIIDTFSSLKITEPEVYEGLVMGSRIVGAFEGAELFNKLLDSKKG